MIRDIITTIMEKLYPKGVYINVKMREDSYEKLKVWMQDNIPDLEQNHDQHCTIIYSKGEYDIDMTPANYYAETKFKNFSLFGPEHDTLVAEIDAPSLVKRNKDLVDEHGFTSDFPDYKPHFSLAYGVEVDITTLAPIDFPIYFEDETISELNTDWKPKIK